MTKKKSSLNLVLYLLIVALVVYIFASVIPGIVNSAEEGVKLVIATFFLNLAAGLGLLGRILGLLVFAGIIYLVISNSGKIVAATDRWINIALGQNPYRYDLEVLLKKVERKIQETNDRIGITGAGIEEATRNSEDAQKRMIKEEKDYWDDQVEKRQAHLGQLEESLAELEDTQRRLVDMIRMLPERGRTSRPSGLKILTSDARRAIKVAGNQLP